MHILDRPAWQALKTRQAGFSLGDAHAARYVADVAPFGAARDDSPESLAALANLVPAHGALILLQAGESPLPPGTVAEFTAPGVQMVLDRLAPAEETAPIVELGEADAPEMRSLAALTRPGPFLARTHLLGDFWGVKADGKLVAMAGERMKLEGFTEVSGVCVHPDFRRRGYAALLSRSVAARILARGETPFLHAYADNRAAIGAYEGLGFKLRRNFVVTALRQAAA